VTVPVHTRRCQCGYVAVAMTLNRVNVAMVAHHEWRAIDHAIQQAAKAAPFNGVPVVKR
jgi:hypothetical protein